MIFLYSYVTCETTVTLTRVHYSLLVWRIVQQRCSPESCNLDNLLKDEVNCEFVLYKQDLRLAFPCFINKICLALNVPLSSQCTIDHVDLQVYRSKHSPWCTICAAGHPRPSNATECQWCLIYHSLSSRGFLNRCTRHLCGRVWGILVDSPFIFDKACPRYDKIVPRNGDSGVLRCIEPCDWYHVAMMKKAGGKDGGPIKHSPMNHAICIPCASFITISCLKKKNVVYWLFVCGIKPLSLFLHATPFLPFQYLNLPFCYWVVINTDWLHSNGSLHSLENSILCFK